MDKKENFRQALDDMFGIGSKKPADAKTEKVKEEPQNAQPEKAAQSAPKKEDKFPFAPLQSKPSVSPNKETTYIGSGTVIEGKIKSKSDIEVAGDFKGDLFCDGKVTLRYDSSSNINASNLELIDCTLTGDVKIPGTVEINEKSVINGKINAKDVICSGQVNGDIVATGNLTLNASAKVIGNIKSGTITIDKGAQFTGNVTMDNVAPQQNQPNKQ